MVNYKMVCLDIDGTLINSQHKITEKTKEVIGRMSIEKQIVTVLVSARMPAGITPFQKELNIKEPFICYSGALILDKDSSVLQNIIIEASDINLIYNIVKKMSIHMSLYKGDEWYVEKMDKWVEQESEITHIKPKITNLNSLVKKWEQEKSGANKILCMGIPADIELLNEHIRSLKLKNLNVYPSKSTYLEIMSHEVSKTSAINYLRKKFNVERTDIISIGDNYNDVDMIEYAGLGIAMGNAPDKVKESADEVTLTNDEDGVAVVLEKYIL